MKLRWAIFASVIAMALFAGAANAADRSYFVAKFEGRQNAKLAFHVKGETATRVIFGIRLNCKGTPYLSGSLGDIPLGDGNMFVESDLGGQSFVRLRGYDVPTAPAGKLRVRLSGGWTGKSKTCRSGAREWSASEVTKREWRKYRRKIGDVRRTR